MKKFLESFCTFTLFLPIFSGITSAQFIETENNKDSKFPKTVFERTEKQISNLKNSENSRNPENFDSWEWRNVKSILEVEQQGGFSLFSLDSDIDEVLDILSGKSSMKDSMQLGDFSSGLENKKQFLEDVKNAIENYKRNSNEHEYPESLEDFKKYEGERWAEIRVGSFMNDAVNISEISDLVEYEKKTEFSKSDLWQEIENHMNAYWSISTSHPSGDINSSSNKVWLNRWSKKDKKWIQVKDLGKFNSLYFSSKYIQENKPKNGYNRIKNNPHKKNISSEITQSDRYLFLADSFQNFSNLIKNKQKECYASNFSGGNTERDDNFWTCLSPKPNFFESLLKQETQSTFTLSLKPQKFNINISDIKTIETKSHNFEELIEELSEDEKKYIETIPEIYSLIPSDTFSVYFSNPQKYREFSETLSNPLSEISEFSPLPTVNKMEEMIGKRLGIGDPKKFLGTVTEFAFVVDDIRIFPSSDFAIIFKCKSDLACKIFGAEKIGKYFVLASDKSFLGKIKRTQPYSCPKGAKCKVSHPIANIKNEKDFQYSWAVTENRRDGFVYFSDSFIRKMVSPEYRINLRRQKAVVETMNTLQYLVWVYKKNDVNNKFQKKISDLVEKKYIPENSIYELEKYSLDTEGIVHHEIWGTPFDITPVTRVPIRKISEGEKKWYEDDVDMYQSNYQEFFDPIGVSITVADKIAFHTVILPLSDSKEYKILKTIGGNISKENFDLAGKYPTAVEGIMSFDVDEILYETGKLYQDSLQKAQDSVRISDIMTIKTSLEMYYSDYGEYPNSLDNEDLKEYFSELPKDPTGDKYMYKALENPRAKEGSGNNCYRITARLSEDGKSKMENDNGIDPNLFETGNFNDRDCEWFKKTLSLTDKKPRKPEIKKKPSKDEVILQSEKEFSKEINLNFENSDERIFDFLGDEIMLGFGENMTFDFDVYDTEGLDIFLTLKLKNKEKAEKFFLAFVKSVVKDGIGFIQIGKPIRNTWVTGKNGEEKKEYYSLPLGFVNIFVFFDEDRVSFAVSQKTIHNMIEEGEKDEKGENFSGIDSKNFRRLNTFLEGPKNILLTADTQKIANWLEILPPKIRKEFNKDFLEDILEIKAYRDNNHSYEAEYFLLSEVLGEKFMKEKFSYYPEYLGFKAEFDKNKKLFWTDLKTGQKISEENILKKVDLIEKLQKFLTEYGEVGLSFAFTEHGAEIKIAFDNASNKKIDKRFECCPTGMIGTNLSDGFFVEINKLISSEISNTQKILLGGFGILLILGFFYFLRRK